MQEALAVLASLTLEELDVKIAQIEMEILAWKSLRVLKRATQKPALDQVVASDVLRCVQAGLGEVPPPPARAEEVMGKTRLTNGDLAILFASKTDVIRTAEIASALGISRPLATYHLEKAVASGVLRKIGNGSYLSTAVKDDEEACESGEQRQRGSHEDFLRRIASWQGVIKVTPLSRILGLDWSSTQYHCEKAAEAGVLVKLGNSAYVLRNGNDADALREQYQEAALNQ